jgi:hypothetical protein
MWGCIHFGLVTETHIHVKIIVDLSGMNDFVRVGNP